MKRRTPRAFMAAAALALLAGACTDTPTGAPSARAPGGRASFSTSSSGPTLVSNAVRYRDTGGKPATGRSGNAVVSAFAVLDKEGVTTLDFGARHATTWVGGTITRAQVKTAASDGTHKYTRNLEPYFGHHGPIPGPALLQGLGRGDQVRLQANVENVDAPRVDVVTVTETVKRLPDLTLELAAPAQVEANTHVNVMGVVRERNGDLGAFAYCELYVDDEMVDIVWNLWVDAGDAVTCATTVSFSTPGTYALRMRVRTPSWEREWDTENNTDTATVQVNGETPQFYTSAGFSHSTSVQVDSLRETWEYPQEGWGNEYGAVFEQVYTGQYGDMYGTMPARMSGPADLRLGMSTGGRVVDAAELSVPDSFQGCTSYWGGRTTFHLCSNGDLSSGRTTFNYSYMAGAVTYHSREYSRVWDHLTGEESVYHWNTDSAYDETVPVGDDWTFTVRFSTPSGEHDLSRTLLLEPYGYAWALPYECYAWGDPSWGYHGTSCSGVTYREWGVAGYTAD